VAAPSGSTPKSGNAGDQPAATDTGHHGIEFAVGGDLEPDGAVAGDQHRVIEGMHQCQVAFLLELAELLESGVDVAVQDAFGAIGPRCRHLAGHRGLGHPRCRHLAGHRGLGHHYYRLHSQPGGGEGDALGVVAGGDGDDTARRVVGVERGDTIERAARLERPGFLQVLAFERQLVAARLRQAMAAPQRRAMQVGCDALRGGADIVDCRCVDAGHGGARGGDCSVADGQDYPALALARKAHLIDAPHFRHGPQVTVRSRCGLDVLSSSLGDADPPRGALTNSHGGTIDAG